MNKDLTNSDVHRQNILNNPYALEKIEVHFAFPGKQFEGQPVFTKADLASLFEVNERTIERYIAQHTKELGENGYRVLKGKSLRGFSGQLVAQDANDEPAAALLARIRAEREAISAKSRKVSVGYKLSPTESSLRL